jgi:hypothetical protein
MKTQYPILLLFGLLLTSCAAPAAMPKFENTITVTPGSTITAIIQMTGTPTAKVPTVQKPTASETPPLLEKKPTENVNPAEGDAMKTIFIKVGNSTFPAKLYDNPTASALLAQFPLKLNMSELNGREKFYNLPGKLPAEQTETPATIQAGEIMLWSSNCLVLFYSTFPNSYGGYVKLGYVEDITGLAAALGSASAQVTFDINN